MGFLDKLLFGNKNSKVDITSEEEFKKREDELKKEQEANSPYLKKRINEGEVKKNESGSSVTSTNAKNSTNTTQPSTSDDSDDVSDDVSEDSGELDNAEKIVSKIINKLDELKSSTDGKIAEIEKKVEDMMSNDVDSELSEIKEKLTKLENSLKEFASIYEALSAQYNPLLDGFHDSNNIKPKVSDNNSSKPLNGQDNVSSQQAIEKTEVIESTNHEDVKAKKLIDSKNDVVDSKVGESVEASVDSVASAKDVGTNVGTKDVGPKDVVANDVDSVAKDVSSKDVVANDVDSVAKDVSSKDVVANDVDSKVGVESDGVDVKGIDSKGVEASVDVKIDSKNVDLKSDVVDSVAKDVSPKDVVANDVDSKVVGESVSGSNDVKNNVVLSKSDHHVEQIKSDLVHSDGTSVGTNLIVSKSDELTESKEQETKESKESKEKELTDEERSAYLKNKIVSFMISEKKMHLERLSRTVDYDKRFVTSQGDISNLLDLIYVINNSDEIFYEHVNSKKDDFGNWIDHVLGFADLALKLKKVKDKQEYLLTILSEI